MIDSGNIQFMNRLPDIFTWPLLSYMSNREKFRLLFPLEYRCKVSKRITGLAGIKANTNDQVPLIQGLFQSIHC
jgi:hypothetical protein